MLLANFTKKRYLFHIAISILLITGGIVIGFYVSASKKLDGPLNYRENNPSYRLINPLLLFDVSKTEALTEYSPLKKELLNFISRELSLKHADNISVYFRDLNSGRWTGVDEDEKYKPGSMLKVATLIAYLRKSEVDSSLLSTNVYFAPGSVDLNNSPHYQPLDPVKPGLRYTSKDLIKSMIVDSDNNATALLTQLMGEESLLKIYGDLKLPMINAQSFEGISPEEYSRIYRVLYNSTYLSHSLSEEVLDLLSQTNFKNGLVAGVPSGTVIAHKFGEHSFTNTSNKTVRELHDCGIVYHEHSPYFLCVMTRGTDFTYLESIISNLSEIVWNSV